MEKLHLAILIIHTVVFVCVVSSNDDKNVFGEDLEVCCTEPLTGFYRNGYCSTGPADRGVHVVCATVTQEFLDHSKNVGNDLSTSRPEYNFPGLKHGDCWCLCALRWKDAIRRGVAPPINLRATHQRVLDFIPLQTLQQYNNNTDKVNSVVYILSEASTMDLNKPSTNHFCEHLLIKCRLINAAKLQMFTTSNRGLYKRVRKQLGWSKVVANVALNAYYEFLEMKVITKDFEDTNIIPSWCVREVWKTHALCDAKEYEDGCKGLCGKLVKYQIEVKPDPDCQINHSEQYTEHVYKARYNRNLPKPIWSFQFNPLWKNEYQTEEDMRYSKKIKEIKTGSAVDNSSASCSTVKSNNDKSLKETLKSIAEKCVAAVENVKKTNVRSFYNRASSATGNDTSGNSSNNTDNVPGPSQQNIEQHQEQSNSSATIKNRKGTKRPLSGLLRNPIMTRSRTKVLKIDV